MILLGINHSTVQAGSFKSGYPYGYDTPVNTHPHGPIRRPNTVFTG